jgi:hypothetical protein
MTEVPRDERGRFRRAARSQPSGTVSATSTDVNINEAGADRLEELDEEFRRFLSSDATLNARRRDARAADDSDVSEAYRRLIKPRSRPWLLDATGDLCLAIAGAFAGFGGSLFLAEPPNAAGGWAATLAAAVIGIAAVVMKYVPIH